MLWTLIFKSENNKNYNGLIQSGKKHSSKISLSRNLNEMNKMKVIILFHWMRFQEPNIDKFTADVLGNRKCLSKALLNLCPGGRPH